MLWSTLAISAPWVSSTALAATDLPDQILVLRAPPSTRLSAEHVPGDAVVRLKIVSPPRETLETLRSQRGSFVRDVEHLLLANGRLELMLRLTTDAVEVSVRRLRSPSAWAIELTPRPVPPFPKRSDMLGFLPGVPRVPFRPVILPPPSRDTPCTGNPDAPALLERSGRTISTEAQLESQLSLVDEPMCRAWIISSWAADTLEAGAPPAAFERWAYLFAVRTYDWPLHPAAFARASLVAAEVLTRRGYYPEAEALLADADRYGPQHAVSRAMALAGLFFERDERNEAETLYAELVAEGFEPSTIVKASTGRALNALSGGDTAGALAHVERARRAIEAPEGLPGALWVLGTEAALARNEIELARKYADWAARSADTDERAFGILRLADLEHRRGRTKSALKGWDIAEASRVRCVPELVQLRRVVASEKDVREIYRRLESQSSFALCEATQMEALYGLAEIHLSRGEELLALEPALRIAKEGVSRWGPARPQRALVTRIAASAVKRLERAEDPAELVRFFEAHLEPFVHLLAPESKHIIANAYREVGAPERAAHDLLDLVITQPDYPRREQLVLDLGYAFLGAKDTYRTDLVLRDLEANQASTASHWRRRRLVGRYQAAVGHPDRALSALSQARAAAPAGDIRKSVELEIARLQLEEGKLGAAVASYAAAADSDAIEPSELAALGIDLISECSRSCSQAVLERAAKTFSSRVGPDGLSPRLIELLDRRGVDGIASATASEPESSTREQLWSRLDALGINPLSKR